MCGWNENNGYISSPPRKYHYKVLSGALTFLSHQYDCSKGTTSTVTYSGRVTPDGGWYEPARCSFTPAESGWMEDSEGVNTGPTRQVYASYREMRTTTITATTTTYTGNGYCRCDGSTWCSKMSGTAAEKLVEEDTEEMAEARAKAALTTWSHQTDYSCLNLASFRTVRGNKFSWSWTQVQRRGITPDYDATMATQAVYRVVLKWYTTATNANGAIVSEGLVELTHSPGWVGDIYTEWADIPIPDAGLFAYAGECRISLVSAGVPRPPNPEET